MTTFIGEPNLTVGFMPPIGLLKHVHLDENGEFTTENERIIKRFMDRPEIFAVKADSSSCKKCEYTTDNKGLLMAHYRTEHPKEGQHE